MGMVNSHPHFNNIMNYLDSKYFNNLYISDKNKEIIQDILDNTVSKYKIKTKKIISKLLHNDVDDLLVSYNIYITSPTKNDNMWKLILGNKKFKSYKHNKILKFRQSKYGTTDIVKIILQYKFFKDNNIYYENISEYQKSQIIEVHEYLGENLHDNRDWYNSVMYFVKYNLDCYVERIKSLKQVNNATLESFVLRYGKEIGNKKYHEVNKVKTKHLKHDSKIQKERSLKSKATKKGNRDHSIRCNEHWIKKGFTILQASLIVSNLQKRKWNNTSKEKYKNTFKNKPIDEIKMINLKKGHSIKAIMARGYTREEAEIISLSYYKKRRPRSKISLDFFKSVTSLYEDKTDFYFQDNNYEYPIDNYFVDFYDKKTKTVIEFYGDYWHGNPMKYKLTDKVYKKTVSEIQEYDKKRKFIIENNKQVNNFFIIWESEYRNNKNECIILTNKLINELRNKK